MRVFVKNLRNQPLMPTTPAKAKQLLKSGKAKCVCRCPFTIKLLISTGETKQELFHGVDTGSKTIGSAVVNSKNKVVYLSEIEIRNDITDKMKQRSKYRRNRRNRKIRYRKTRFLNRKNSIGKDRFSPTMESKINSHLKEIKFVKSILPISKIILETATFDAHLLKNPKVEGAEYQQGANCRFANTKAFVLDRDNYICQYCKFKNTTLNVHHILFKSQGGGDEQENLITLCKTCHSKLHKNEIVLKKTGKRKTQLKHATQMNSIKIQLLKVVDCEETFGYITKEHRQLLNLSKEHYNDAIAISCLNNIQNTGLLNIDVTNNYILLKKCVSKGDYQQTKGVRSEQNIPTGKIQGFRKFDKVEYLGSEYFIKGRMSTGFAILMDIEGNKIDFKDAPKGMKTPKMENIKRIASRKTWIISQKIIVNV